LPHLGPTVSRESSASIRYAPHPTWCPTYRETMRNELFATTGISQVGDAARLS
jgi:hypothetical protein